MKQLRQHGWALVLVAGLGWPASALAQGQGSATRHGNAPEVALALIGSYRLQEEGTDLRLDIESQAGTDRSGNLLATLAGRFQGRSLDEQALLHLDNQGSQVLLTVTPSLRHGPEARAKSAREVNATEAKASCALYLSPSGHGWTGTAQEPAHCVALLPEHQDVGRWRLVVLPGELRVSDAASRRSLVFQKVSESGQARR